MFRKRMILVPICLLFITSIFPGTPTNRALAGNYADISAMEAKTMINQKPSLVILDVRNQSEYDGGHIRNAKLIPVWQLAERLDKLSKNNEILVYCGWGARSASASLILSDNGFTHVYNMLGGLTAWINASYPVYVKYPSIQAAINNATEGGAIYVSTGTYDETLNINKPITLAGENRSTTIIDGKGNGNVIEVAWENVTVTGFTIQGSGCGCADYAGIYARWSRNLNITENSIINNGGYSIKLVKTSDSTIGHNEITGNANSVEITFSNSSMITGNKIIDNQDGLNLNPSYGSIIKENNISFNSMYNVMLRSSNQNIFRNNVVTYSTYGIRHYSSFNNTFTGNLIQFNGIGIDFQNSSSNTFYQNNFVEDQVWFSEVDPIMPNTWDGGNVTGGNYWNNYTGTDSNGDGIGDSPKVIDSGNKDNFPLLGVFSTYTVSEISVFSLSSNSTVEDFQYSNGTIRIRVTNSSTNQIEGFCRLAIPQSALTPPYTVTVNGDPITHKTLFENDTLSIIYFTYNHSTLEINVVPEYQIPVYLLLMGVLVFFALVVHRKKRDSSSAACTQVSS